MASSSTISDSRAPSSFTPCNRSRLICFHSGIFNPRDAADGLGKLLPASALRGEHFAPFSCKSIKAPPPLTGLLHPAALNPTPRFQPVEQRIERGHLEMQRA